MKKLELKNLRKSALTKSEQQKINGGWYCPHYSAYYCAVDPWFAQNYPHCC